MFKTIEINTLLLHTMPSGDRELIVVYQDGTRKSLFTVGPERHLQRIRRLCQRIALNFGLDEYIED
jgi:hypothetical protein